jgi:cytochrome P450
MATTLRDTMNNREDELIEAAKRATEARCPALAGYNPISPAEVANPYPSWEKSQRDAPVVYVECIDMWMVTPFELISQILRDTETFSNEGIFQMPVPEGLAERLPYGWPAFGVPSLINTDPPTHTAIRKIVQQVLTPRLIGSHHQRIREIASDRLDALYGQGHCEYVADFARPFVSDVLAEILGVENDVDARAQFAQWSDDAFHVANPGLSPEEMLERGGRLADLKNYLEEAVAKRRVEPTGDLLSLLTHARDDEAPMLTTPQIVGVVSQLVNAGTDTTVGLIINTMYFVRTQYRDMWDRMIDDPTIVPAVLEEVLRLQGPIRGFMRITRRETELGGVVLPKGAKLFMANAAACSDASVFPEPRQFNIDRPNIGQHVAFGRGTHFCIGAPLGRLDARIVMEETLKRMPDIEVDSSAEIRWAPMLFSQTLETLPVTWTV